MKVIFFAMLLCFGLNSTNADPKLPSKIKVVIDTGLQENGLSQGLTSDLEQQVVRDISQQLKALCVDKNIEIILFTTDNEFGSNRIQQIEALSPDLVISLNASYSTQKDRNCVDVYVAHNDFTEKSSYFGTKILESFKQKDFKTTSLQSTNYDLLRDLNCPAISIELGLLNVAEDMLYLNSEFGKKFLAKQIVSSLNP